MESTMESKINRDLKEVNEKTSDSLIKIQNILSKDIFAISDKLNDFLLDNEPYDTKDFIRDLSSRVNDIKTTLKLQTELHTLILEESELQMETIRKLEKITKDAFELNKKMASLMELGGRFKGIDNYLKPEEKENKKKRWFFW